MEFPTDDLTSGDGIRRYYVERDFYTDEELYDRFR